MTQLHGNERDLARMQVTISDSMISKILTPLELIKAHANQLLQDKPDSKVFQQITSLSLQLTCFARDHRDRRLLEKNEFEVDTDPVNLKQLIQETLQTLQTQADLKGVQLVLTDKTISMPKLLVDHNRVQQVLMILLLNAIKYSQNLGTVSVKINNTDNNQQCNFTCRVTDSGIGIKESEHSKIFKPFYCNDAYEKVRIDHGFGMGLNLCYHILKRMGGSLSLLPSNHRGTCFEIKIPLHRAKIKSNRPLLDTSILRNTKKVIKIGRKTSTPKAEIRRKLMECELSDKDDIVSKKEP